MNSTISVTSTSRVVALVDMDCFYVQVEERDDPAIKGIPAAVVQYKTYKGGGIIAVNYEARAKGVTRNMRGDDAKAVCPEIVLVRVPENRGKADLTKYRDAGKEVINVLTEFSSCVERASIDEAYIDLTEVVDLRLAEISSQDMFATWSENIVQSLNMEFFSTNFVLGYDSTQDWLDMLKQSELPTMDDFKLAVGAEIVGKMRNAVYEKTGFRCSAGIAHNKVLAKLVCGINKPNKQTILPHGSVPNLWSRTKVGKVRGLGGKLGEFVESLGCVFMSDLGRFTEKQLCNAVGPKTGTWLYQLSLGFDDEAVTPRQLPKSIGCNKNFFGPEALKTKDKARFWINQLASEVVERIQRDLETNNRRAKTLTLHVKFENQGALSRSCGAPYYNAERMAEDVNLIMEKLYQHVGVLPINSLGLIASKFEDEVDTTGNFKINDFFKAKPSTSDSTSSSSSTEAKTNASDAKSKPQQASSSACLTTLKQHNQNDPPQGTSNSVAPVSSSRISSVVPDPDKNVAEPSIKSSVQQNSSDKTPKKSNPSDETVRKPFFQFVLTAPKTSSPHKSPRKPPSSNQNATNKAVDVTSNRSFTEANASMLKVCERCGKKIIEWEMESHMDYHFAKDLSRELNGLPAINPNSEPETSKSKTGTELMAERGGKTGQKRPRGRGGLSLSSKRGRGSKSTSVSLPSTSSRTIDSYFVPKS